MQSTLPGMIPILPACEHLWDDGVMGERDSEALGLSYSQLPTCPAVEPLLLRDALYTPQYLLNRRKKSSFLSMH